ncbi:acyltransferase family protein [Lysobacter capsici]|uniref:acyltransferase family protein n=1 Tax=Lysobacter capsici TaxID=435897 RepID=UPI00068912F2|nr:acyltransferase [Lysobacter capsici]
MGKIGLIQVLRAYAALWVVWRHTYYQGFEVGVFGVDVFFVISGFIMAYICAEQAVAPGRFLLRRTLRIAPLYWLVTCAAFGLALLAPHLFNSTTGNWSNLLKSLLFIPYLKENGTVMPVIPVGWTLNCEMLFYLAMSACLGFGRKHAALAAAAGLAMLPVVVRADLADSPAAWFYSQPVMAEFLFGVLAFMAWSRLRKLELWVPVLAVTAALSALSLPILEWQRGAATAFAGRLFLLGVPAATLVLSAALLDGRCRAVAALKNRVALILGDASYSIYLSHIFVIEGLRKVVFPRTGLFDMTTFAGAFAALTTAALVGVVIHRLVERPLMGLRSYCNGLPGTPPLASGHAAGDVVVTVDVSDQSGASRPHGG